MPAAKAAPPEGKTFPIVGIGASAGGLDAFTELLSHLPVDLGMGFVLVQHLDPTHESALTEILGRVTAMPVSEIVSGQMVLPNHVYIIPPNASLTIHHGVLSLEPRRQPGGAQHSIDLFFQSLAQDQHERAIGVVLSGTASDGTPGLEAIKAEGGITFAQDENSAKYDSMPQSAITAGCVDFVLSPEKIALELARVARHPYVASVETSLAASDSGALTEILRRLHQSFGVDFSLYKSNTILRRLTRRVVLQKFNTMEEYAGFLQGNVSELRALYSDILINVTGFFRNPEAFEALKRIVFAKLFSPQREGPVRIWVTGCSTGQEAYSLAMSFEEYCGQVPGHAPRLQVFATDINEAVLVNARRGLYSKSLMEGVSPERLRRFFVEEDGGYRVCKRIRDLCVFARQSILSDPPFSRMDLVSCRNLLIYLEPEAQKKVLQAFHYALKSGGFLFLGLSESIGEFSGLFECLDKQQKLFSRRPGSTPAFPLPEFRSHLRASPQFPAAESGRQPGVILDQPSAQREADRITLKQFGPPGLLVNADLQILEFRGALGPYLELPPGKPSFDLLRLARGGLDLPLHAAIDQAKREDRPVCRKNLQIRQSVGTRTTDLYVIPLKNLKERCYLILFTEPETRSDSSASGLSVPVGRTAGDKGAGAHSALAGRPTAKARDQARRIAALERELAEARDERQSIQGEHEAANEEFQAANEELTTVNEEMLHRNTELNCLNSDLNNLQTSVHLAVVVLGRDLTIRRFSPLAETTLNLHATDVGRPFGALKHTLDFPGLQQFVSQVIETIQMKEQEVRDKDGHWYLLRARPYLTLDNKIDGATLVLVDIHALKMSEQVAQAARAGLERVAEDKDELMGILTHDLKNMLAGMQMSTERLRESNGSLADPKMRLMVENLWFSSSRMLAFVKEFLTNASFEHGLTIKTEPISLSEAIAQAIGQYQEAALRKEIHLQAELPQNNVVVQADAAALRQILCNLLSNAVKFSPPGKLVSIGARSLDGCAECYVQDQGPGFTEQDKKRMFQRYVRLSARSTGGEPSAGLGLSIIKKLVEALAGTLTCESRTGSGARFTVRFPTPARH